MPPLSDADKATLVALARAAVQAAVEGRPPPALPGVEALGALGAPGGAFVALRAGGALRGAVGRFEPEPAGGGAASLAATVASQAALAAASDPRFPPLAAEDLASLRVSVAAVGPLRPLPDRAARLSVRVGEEGLRVTRGWHRGMLLPAAARAGGWDAAAFLKHVCLQAGLHARAWEEPETALEAFAADEFGDAPDAEKNDEETAP